MEWDAQRLYKFDGKCWSRFINEPWTANRWWELQSSSIPPSGKPLCLLFYADKNKLSSFGTAKGYPIITRILNLPEHIRNGIGPGGGRVVGWLPIVPEEAEHTHKKDYVDFKAVVWHTSVRHIFSSIAEFSQTGCTLRCGDKVTRSLYPLFLIESADYEEQCTVCLIRGLKGLCPCPRCFVSKNNLSDLSLVSELRTATHAVEVYNKAQAMETKKDQEEYIKQFSMRLVENAFFSIANSEPFRGVSFDDLHSFNSGSWGDHIFPQLKRHVAKIGRKASVKLDERFDMIPPWRNLNHFRSISTVSFNDGSHHRDISKLFLFAAYGVITEKNDATAYCLMKTVRKYINMYMYSSLDVQTEATIKSGRKVVEEFHSCLQEYMEFEYDEDSDLNKSWDFIKLHYIVHLFDDIEDKGAQRNFSTMPNEKLHGPLRKIYKLMTNFKNVGEQVLKKEHQFLVAGLVRGQIDELDAYYEPEPDDEEEKDVIATDPHIVLASKRPSLSFHQLELDHAQDKVFHRFRIRLSDYMSNLLPASGIPLPGNKRVKFVAEDMVLPYQFLKIGYESMETWRLVHDFLRCNPQFHGKPRYDFIIFQSSTGPIFAQLCYIFKCFITSDNGDIDEYLVALVQPYKVVRQRPKVDKDWGLLRMRKQADSEFISVRSIVRGALVVSTGEKRPEYALDVFVIDVVDADMFLRVKELFPGFT